MCGVDNLLKLTTIGIWVIDILGLPMDIFYYWATTVPTEELLATAYDQTVQLVAFAGLGLNLLLLLLGQGYINFVGTYYIA